MNTSTQAPEIIYVNPRTMQVVGEGYPNAVKYVLAKETVHNWQEDQPHHIPEYNGHASHDLIDTIPTRE